MVLLLLLWGCTQGEVNASMSAKDITPGTAEPGAMSFTSGVYKTRLQLSEGGVYQLKLDFNGSNGLPPTLLEFQLDDNRLFARNALIIVLAGVFTALTVFISVFYTQKKKTIPVNVGRKLTCDI